MFKNDLSKESSKKESSSAGTENKLIEK